MTIKSKMLKKMQEKEAQLDRVVTIVHAARMRGIKWSAIFRVLKKEGEIGDITLRALQAKYYRSNKYSKSN